MTAEKLKKQLQKMRRDRRLIWLTPFFKALPEAEIFFVGGAVRDAALGLASKDLDLVVRNVSANKLKAFLNRHGRVDLVGKRFGVFKFLPSNIKKAEPIDIALPRTEHSLGTGAYRDFHITSDACLSITDDLSRRDLTINALAWDIKNQRLIDPWRGWLDLQNKKIRTVGLPRERFQEDASRLLRAIRLACQLNFEIEPETWAAIKKNIKLLDKKMARERIVPYEVIGKELVKALTSSPAKALTLLDESGALGLLIPEIIKTKNLTQGTKYHREGTVWQHLNLALKNLTGSQFKRAFHEQPLNAELVIATMLHDIGKIKTQKIVSAGVVHFYRHETVGAQMAKRICERLKLNQYPKNSRFGLTTDHIWWLIKHHLVTLQEPRALKAGTLEKYYFSATWPGQTLLQLQWADMKSSVPANGKPNMRPFIIINRRLKQLSQTKKLPKPLLTGEQVMATLRLKPGPAVGRALAWLRETQLNGGLKTVTDAIRALRAKTYEKI